MKELKFVLICLLAMMIFVSCDNNDEEDDPEEMIEEVLVDPTSANAIAGAISIPNGTTTMGTPPAPSTAAEAPRVTLDVARVESSNGSTAPLFFTYSNVNGDLGGCYVQVAGSDRFVTVPYTGSDSSSSGILQLPVTIPSNVDAGEFCLNYCVYDDQGRVSNVINTCVNVLRLGTGSIQISLSWDNFSDQDLHVVDPTGKRIYFNDPTSASGGQLDRDDTDGFGPENIFWLENAPDGAYKVQVHDFDGTVEPTNFYITISTPGSNSRNYEGTTVNRDTANVVTFRKAGDTYTF